MVAQSSKFYFNSGGSRSADIYLRHCKDLRIADSIFSSNYNFNMTSISFENLLEASSNVQLWNTSFELEGFTPLLSNDANFLWKARTSKSVEMIHRGLVTTRESYYASGKYLFDFF